MGRKQGSHSFAGGALILAASNILCRFLGFVFKVPLANLIGAEGIGYYGFALQIFSMISAVSVSGLPIALSTTIAAAPLQERVHILSASRPIFRITGLAGTALLALGAGCISHLAGSEPSKMALLVLAPAVFLSAIESLYRGYFEGIAQMKAPALAQLLDALTKLFLGTAVAWYLYRAGRPMEQVASGAVLGITAGTAVSAAVLAISGSSAARGRGGRTAAGAIRRKLLRMACPLTLGALFLSVLNAADAMMIMKRLQHTGLTQSEAAAAYGAYTGIALTVYSLPTAVTSAICASVIPAVASAGDLNTQTARRRACRTLNHAFRLASVLVMFAAVLFAVMPDFLLQMLFSRRGDIATAVPLLRMLAPAAVLSATCSLSASALHAMGSMIVPVLAMAAGGVTKLVLNSCLIGQPAIRILGAPIGTTACFAVAAGVNLLAVCKKLHFCPPLLDGLLKPAGFAVLTVFLARKLTGSLRCFADPRVGTALALCMAGLLYVGLLLVGGVIKRDDWHLLKPLKQTK